MGYHIQAYKNFESCFGNFISLPRATCCVQICEGYNIDRTMELDMDKRAYSDPEDPRNLFAAMYGGVYKREDPYDLRCGIYYYLQI